MQTSTRSTQERSSSNSSLESVEGVVATLRHGAGDLAEKAQGVASDFAERAQEYGGKALGETTSFIRRHPTETLIAGFGLGLIIGFAASRR